MTRAALALARIPTACGSAPGPSPHPAPQRVQGCAGIGYELGTAAAACDTLSPLSAAAADLATACAPGWAACSSPPAGCSDLPGFHLGSVGSVGSRPADGTDAAGGCGARRSRRTVPVG